MSRPTPSGAAAEECDWHRGGRMDCIRRAPPAERGDVIVQSPGSRGTGDSLVMSGEHSCGQLTGKTWVSLIFALSSSPRGRSQMQQRDKQKRLESSTEAVPLREARFWRRTHSSRLSASAVHSLARDAGDGAHHVIVLIPSAFRLDVQQQKWLDVQRGTTTLRIPCQALRERRNGSE
jgi:hypothetical protein